MDFRKLKSGSDVRGVAIGEKAVFTEEIACALGYAFAKRVAANEGVPVSDVSVAVGRDSRLSGEALQKAVLRGISAAGAKAVSYGMCTTPAMYMAILTEGFAPNASIMITASHLPWERNGMKFFEKDGGVKVPELDAILEIAQQVQVDTLPEGGVPEEQDYLSAYTAGLKQLIINEVDPEVQKPLLGLHVVVDAGNGAGGFYAKMLEDLGAWTEGSQFLEPDGHFPNHIPNPEDAQAMASVSETVRRLEADLGIIFDADCDRAAIVDETGREINRNRLIAMISAILLENAPGATIVTDSVTSTGLTDFIHEWGGEHYRFKRGYRNVIDEAIRLNKAGIDCPLAIETSGHAALRQNHFLDDGMYLVTLLLIKAMQLKQQGQLLSSLLDTLREPVESCEVRFPILAEDFSATAKQTIEHVLEYASDHEDWHLAPDNREGVRISFDADGELSSAWFLLRISLHDPVMSINAESDVPGGVKYVLSKLEEVIRECPGLDLTPLENKLKNA